MRAWKRVLPMFVAAAALAGWFGVAEAQVFGP
jgi:hypothetical protein